MVASQTSWGVPLILGLSESTEYKPKLYTTLEKVYADHCKYDSTNKLLGISPVARAAQALMAQGLTRFYIMGIPCGTDRKPTSNNIAAAKAVIQPLAIQGTIDTIVFAGIYVNNPLVSEYVDIANTCKLVFAMTNAPGQTATDIVTCVSTNVKSRNGFIVAHNEPTFTNEVDFTTNGQEIGIGDGTKVVFNIPNYPITNDPVITVGGVSQTVTTDYTLDKATGVVTFDADSIPGAAKAVICKYKAAIPKDDVGAVALGALALNRPWNSMIWRAVFTPVGTYFDAADIATLETAGINVIINVASSNRLSNSLTASGSPKFIDIVRTEYYSSSQLRNAMLTLRLNSAKIPFTESGLDMVRVSLRSAMERLLRDAAISTYTITMPTVDTISTEDRGNRILRGVKVAAQLSGDVHTFQMDLIIQV